MSVCECVCGVGMRAHVCVRVRACVRVRVCACVSVCVCVNLLPRKLRTVQSG